MKTIACFTVLILSCLLLSGQESKKDSILYQGKYYMKNDPGYEAAKKYYDSRNYEINFMPGLGYSVYNPKGSDSTGMMQGFVVEYLLFCFVSENDKPGPSHVRWYSKFNIMKSDKEEITDLFYYALGVSFSFEKNPKRRAMIPYFGLELAGSSQKQWGTTAVFTPTAGLHWYFTRNIMVHTQAGYTYPVTNFDLLQGWFYTASLNFALW